MSADGPGDPLAVPYRTGTPRAVVLVHAAAGALACLALGHTLWRGLSDPGIALAFGALIAVGELARGGSAPPARGGAGTLPGDRESAPLGVAGALAYALLGEVGGRATSHGVLQAVAVVVAAGLVGLVPHVALGRGPALDHIARRVLTVGFAATCFQPLYTTGRLAAWIGNGSYYICYLLGLLALTALCDAVLAAALARARTGWPYGPLLRDELRSLLGIGSAICATGLVIALATAVAGLWALPVFCLPLLLTQLSFRRYAAVRATYRQTIASLARATEIAGYTPQGHARRVAVLSRAVGRELGLGEADLSVLEYAALMHDIGQLSLVDPVTGGATAGLPPAEQRRIALLGGAVVRRTGVPAEVAMIVERQADPFRDQPLPARIVRTVNAYDDLAGGDGGPGGTLRALERLRLSTAQDFEPRVVEALARVLARPFGAL
ncbi:HD-GYP domain-containing protein [Streptomyces niger]|uniref:HD-GYP domain-containing protein n=1 Tax=Streptomyces niger TaxID=66373 RepID=UPI00069B2679|nr:HD domain-containing protein [Streptomyces niger]